MPTYGFFVPFFHGNICDEHATLAVAHDAGARRAARAPRPALNGAVTRSATGSRGSQNHGPRPAGLDSRPTAHDLGGRFRGGWEGRRGAGFTGYLKRDQKLTSGDGQPER